jgi:hypothetical protein
MFTKPLHFVALTIFLVVLSAQADEKQQTIKLGRTSLAAVSASTVNGSRAMDNKFYGILNAFDDGSNWHDKINYTQWLSDYHATGTYAEIQFDVLVNVTSIIAEGAPPFSARLTAEDGTEQVKNGKDSISFDPPASGIRHIQLTFENNRKGVVEVDEIRIMGMAPDGIKYEVRQPRVIPSKRNLALAADEAFATWLSAYSNAQKRDVRQDNDTVVSVYYIEDVPVMRITIDKHNGSKKVETFSRDKPIAVEKLPEPRPVD